jgi:hypothetical protein
MLPWLSFCAFMDFSNDLKFWIWIIKITEIILKKPFDVLLKWNATNVEHCEKHVNNVELQATFLT